MNSKYLSSPKTIKYPRLNIIGEIIIIEELIKNIDCWKIIFLWFITSIDEIINPAILTIIPVEIEIINELKKDSANL